MNNNIEKNRYFLNLSKLNQRKKSAQFESDGKNPQNQNEPPQFE